MPTDSPPSAPLIIAPADPAAAEPLACVAAYFDELAGLFPQGFDPGPEADPATMRPPEGAFLLARQDGQALGCVALRRIDTATAEVKRLWIAPQARGLGLARRLMVEIEDQARALGYRRLQLDTNGSLTGALALYRGSGWTEIDRYNDNPYAQHWFAKPL